MPTSNTITIEKNGKKYLAVSTNLKAKSFKGINTSKMKAAPGKIIRGGQLNDWKMEGLTEIDDIMFFYGPPVSGRTLNNFSPDENLISELLDAFKLLNTAGFHTGQFCTSSVFRLNNGGLLFFPTELMDFVNKRAAEDEIIKTIQPWNHHALKGEEAQAFTIAALIYQMICGAPAFPDEIKKNDYRSPLCTEPGLRSDLLELIDKSFAGTGTLDHWQKMLGILKTEGRHNRSLTEKEKSEISASAAKKEMQRQRKAKLSLFLTKNRTKLAVSASVTAVILFILISTLSRVLAPPVTIGMEQKEVIELYYNSYNELDFETMEDCITKKAGKPDQNQVVSLTAITKVRTAYEGASNLYEAARWKKDGMPELEQGTILWGLSELTVEELSTPNSYSANYERWSLAESENSSEALPEFEEIKDIIHLSIIKNSWRIDSLERKITIKPHVTENYSDD
ncbi:MAG TPA: hypothetical protein DCO79_08865 [Spirochaeta sp.]|nr:hypothetical protein [Spirochaeta sp.]